MDRFWSKVDKMPGHGPNGDCWLWTACRSHSGYGRFAVGTSNVAAHRVAYEMVVGPIPEGMFACHRCDNRACVNPDHIFLGSASDNTRDAIAKGRFVKVEPRPRQTRCKRGHLFAETRRLSPDGSTSCRRCAAIRQAARYHRQKQARVAGDQSTSGPNGS